MRRIRSLFLALGLIAASGLAVQPIMAATGPAVVDAKRLANPSPNDWVSPGRTYEEQRFSPLNQINADNAGQLGLAWYADLDATRGVEASPLMIDGVIYNIQPWNITTAYDAKTGKVLWRYDPKVPEKFGGLACCDIVTRGLSAWNGKIIIATLDGRLQALDAKTGAVVWSVNTIDDNSWPYTVTGAPRVFDGVVVIGNAGAELATPGYVTAYNADTGKQMWRFRTVPGDPAKGYDKTMQMAAKTWSPGSWVNGGGGTVWDSIVYDPKLKLVYLGTGNGGPWVREYRSPGGGDNLFLSSIVALKVDTGQYVWHYQQTPGDEWDYTATQNMILADLNIKGRLRQVIMQAPKNGFFYILDRKTGELLSADNYVPTNWASHVDMKTGRPVELPGARYGEKPVLLTPSAAGGHNWNPMAYNPMTGLVYIPTLEGYMVYSRNPTFKLDKGKRSQMGIGGTAYEAERKALTDEGVAKTKIYLMAWDPLKSKEVWRVTYPKRGSGGILTTAGNLVFQGTIGETFAAYRADNGAKVWEMPIQQVPIAAPITYMIDGVQYIAVNAGWGGGLAHGPGLNDFGLNLSDSARLMVFKLGGDVQLPPLKTAAVLSPPPAVTGTPAQLKHGAELYLKNCASCHGELARGGIKDLRMMTPQTHGEFQSIVIGGARAPKGMVSFADVISPKDAEDIHQYLNQRANEDWEQIKAGK